MGKLNTLKSPARFKLIAYRSVVNFLTHFATLLDDNFGKETIYKILLDLSFISINNTSQHGGVSNHKPGSTT